MKSYICILLSIILIFSLSACKNNISTMNSSNIDNNPSPSPIVNAEEKLMEYVGTWCESDISWENGGLILDLYVEAGMLSISCSLISSAPDSKSAEIFCGLELEKIKSNPFELVFDDDGWGNSGILELNLNNNKIVANFKNIKCDNTSNWGFKEKKYELIYNEYAHQLIEPDLEDITSNITQIDTSKASGILAQMGMTEQQFRNKCVPLRGSLYPYSNLYNIYADHSKEVIIHRHDLEAGKQYYINHPNDDGVEQGINTWNKICAEYKKDKSEWSSYYNIDDLHYFEKYKTLETYLNEQVYAKKGFSTISANTVNLFKEIKEYPNKYIGQCFVLLDADSKLYDEDFAGLDISIHDLRDDPHNPNIISEYDYYFYVIFRGTHIGYDGLVLDFNLISLEKIS